MQILKLFQVFQPIRSGLYYYACGLGMKSQIDHVVANGEACLRDHAHFFICYSIDSNVRVVDMKLK